MQRNLKHQHDRPLTQHTAWLTNSAQRILKSPFTLTLYKCKASTVRRGNKQASKHLGGRIGVVASGWSVAGYKAFWGPSLDCPISYLSQRGYAITHLPQWASFSVGCKLGKSLIREGSSLGKARVRNNPRIMRDHDIFTLTMGSLTDCNYPFWTGKSSGETLTVASASFRILSVADSQLLCRLPTLSFPRLLRIRCVKDSPVCSSAPSIARAPSCGASALCCQACKHSPRQLDGGK